jgi:hypothetical protein
MRTLSLVAVCLLVIGAQARGLGPILDNPDLNLSADQAKQIGKIVDQQHLDCIQLRADLEKARLEMDLAVRNDASLASLESKLDEVKKAETKLEKTQLKARVEVRKLLDDSQKVVFDRMQGFDGRPGKGHRGGKRGGQGRCGNGPGFGPGSGPGCGPGQGFGNGPCGPDGPNGPGRNAPNTK